LVAVQHLHWQHKISRGTRNAAWDQIVVGLEDIEQAIHIIVLTPKRSVPTEPDKFCDALDYLDRPPAVAIPNITREIWDALAKWEPRILIKGVQVVQVAFEHFQALISWHPVESVVDEILQTSIEIRRAA